MSYWTTESILNALESLNEAPVSDDLVEVVTTDYRLLRFPSRLISPTLPEAQVVWSRTARSIDDLFDEVASVVAGWGLEAVHWWVTSTTRPLETAARLIARGGVVSDSNQILARELAGWVVTGSAPDGIDVELVCDERTLRAASTVETEGWARSTPADDPLDSRLAEVLEDLERGTRFQFVAFIEGRPVSTGCGRIDGEVARLYGAVTLPRYRRRGCYHAILSARLDRARDLGATLALTRGRPLTSGRLLVKSGFTVHGEEHCYRLAVPRW